MNVYDYDVINYLLKEGYTNQRIISENSGYSLGKVNESLQKLIEHDYLSDQFVLTEKAHQEIEDKQANHAVILAAGFGMRMVPINTEVPKGLLEVDGESLIERLIKQLHAANIYDIDIVVGFMKDHFEFLIDEYGVNLIYNPDYALKNNLHSLKLIADKLSNSYILPSDIWTKKNPFSRNELYSWYSVSELIDDESTVRINRQRELISVPEEVSGNRMIGIAYLLEEEAIQLREKIQKITVDSTKDDVFWEEALFNNQNPLAIYARVYGSDEVFEIDTYEQLRELDSHSDNLNTDIIDLIAEEMKILPMEVKNITVLKKGMTNRSFKFTVKGKNYIMRIPGEGTSELINRKQEYDVYQTIKKFKISDELVYMSAENGYKITEYLEDSRECDPFNPEEVNASMKKLRAFHGLKLKVAHSFDIFEEIEFYESLWDGKPSVFRDYAKTKEKVFSLKEFIESMPKEWVLSHIDANPDNLLFVEDEIRMIDWEYAGMQDPDLDIAMFAIYSLYNRKQTDALIESYYHEGVSAERRMKIYAYMSIAGLLWSNWCEFKRFEGVEFGEYSLRQYRYAKDYYDIVKDEWLSKKNHKEFSKKGE